MDLGFRGLGFGLQGFMGLGLQGLQGVFYVVEGLFPSARY